MPISLSLGIPLLTQASSLGPFRRERAARNPSAAHPVHPGFVMLGAGHADGVGYGGNPVVRVFYRAAVAPISPPEAGAAARRDMLMAPETGPGARAIRLTIWGLAVSCCTLQRESDATAPSFCLPRPRVEQQPHNRWLFAGIA